MAEEFNEEEEMIINQEYKIWKKESPDFYDFLLLHSLDWPSYSFQWLPNVDTHHDHTVFHALLASNTSEVEHNHLLKAQISFPSENAPETYFNNKAHKITITEKIPHHGEINRLRYCPAEPGVVAVASGKGQITLVGKEGVAGRLVGHTEEGYGLSWNTVNPHLLASGFGDKKICIWDVEANRQQGGKWLPIYEILHHNAPIEDVAWHRFHPSIFASCSDDRVVALWDTRFRHANGQDDKKPLFQIVAHTDEIYSLDFSPFHEFLFASSSADQNVSIWDMRNLTRALSTLEGEKNEVLKVQWSPFTSSILGSCGYGRNVDIWDLAKEKKDNEHPYLFRHMGHRSRVMDMDWHPTQKLLVGSVQENNCLQIWQINRNLYYEEEETAK